MILLALRVNFPPGSRLGAMWESSAKWLGINIARGQFHEQKGNELGSLDEAVGEQEFFGAVDSVAANSEGVDVGQAGAKVPDRGRTKQ